MLVSIVRTVIIYSLVVVAIRLMGKRQIGELQPTELVVAIMISDLATLPMSDTAIPLLYGVVPILTLIVMEMILSYLCMKSPKIRDAATGRPNYIIHRGKIDQKEMKKARYSLSDLMEELRMLNVFDISTVYCAILETNGKVSVLTRECKDDRAYVLICDGVIQERTLKDSPYDFNDIQKFAKGLPLEKIFLLSVDSNRKVYCVPKE